MEREREDEGSGFDGSWERMRAEERAEQLAHVEQDAARDAKLAALLDAAAAVTRTP